MSDLDPNSALVCGMATLPTIPPIVGKALTVDCMSQVRTDGPSIISILLLHRKSATVFGTSLCFHRKFADSNHLVEISNLVAASQPRRRYSDRSKGLFVVS